MIVDRKKCAMCNTEFDFEKTGLQGPGDIFVCGTECAKASAQGRGNLYAVHDDSGDIVDTDVKPEDKISRHLW